MRERYRRLKLSAYRGNKYQNILVSRGLIAPVRIRTQKGSLKLMKITDKGKKELQRLGKCVVESDRKGGLEHLYWVQQVKDELESNGYNVKVEYPIGNGETVDIAVIGKRTIAIEIETGKSDALHNIRKALKRNFDVLVIATNKQTFKKLRSQVRKFSRRERRSIRIRMTK